MEGDCYQRCPSHSSPVLVWDGAVAQEHSHYDESAVPSECTLSENHLKFDKDGKGVTVPGPVDWTEVPDFTVSFWVYVTDLNVESYFLGMFD